MLRFFAVGMAVAASATFSHASLVTFSATGANGAAIQPTVDSFRSALGTLNPNSAGSFGTGRREINWDGVPDNFSAPNLLPANFFNVNSPRGVVFSTPGTGFQLSASTSSGTPVEFGHINPTYSNTFAAFSPQRLFTALGSNVIDVNFFVPGSANPAFTTGFGAVFTDVDFANTTSIHFFDLADTSIGTLFAPAGAGSETFSFIGGLFNAGEQVGRVRIVSGNAALGPNESANTDLVVMDDFIYAEPRAVAAAVPEPTSLGLLLLGLLLGGRLVRRTQC